LHQLHTRACLRAKKTYGLKVLLISNAFGVSVWRVVLNNPFSIWFFNSLFITRIYRSTRIYLLSPCSRTNTYGEFYAFVVAVHPLAWRAVDIVIVPNTA